MIIEPHVRQSLVWAPRFAIATILLGSAILAGYAVGFAPAWRPLPDGPATHPLTAASFILLGLSVLLARPLRPSTASVAIAVVAGTLAATRLVTMAIGRDDVFQAWSPFNDTLATAAMAGQPILMGLRASTMIILLATALCLARAQHFITCQVAGIAASYPVVFTTFGYIYGVPRLGGVLSLTTIAMGALCIFAILCRTSHRALVRSLLGIGQGGRSLRLQLMILIGMCFLLGLIATRFGFDREAQSLAVESTIIVLIIVLVLLNAAYRTERSGLRPDQKEEEELPLLLDLEGAQHRNEIFLVYQPQVNLTDEEVVGIEVLVRWNHPTRGVVSPAEFIPLAESSGLIKELGAWVLKEACAQAASWQDGILSGVAISVNVSPLQLKETGFAEKVEQISRTSGLPPERLIIEVTESAMVRENDQSFEVLTRLRGLGMHIAIDDFGTGYSSLSYLRDLPSDYLKIDQSFVRDVPGKPEAEAIARAIVAVGKSLGYQIVAEGVETREQAEFLQSIWCDKGQGYLYARPMRAEDLAVWATNRVHHAVGVPPSTSGVMNG